MSVNLLVFDTLYDATEALNDINSWTDNEGNSVFPVIGMTGKQTCHWICSDSIIELNDGRFGFPQVPKKRTENYGITQEYIDNWYTQFNATAIDNAGYLMPAQEV